MLHRVEQLLLADRTEEERQLCRAKAFSREVRMANVVGDMFTEGTSGGIGMALSLLWLFTGIGFR